MCEELKKEELIETLINGYIEYRNELMNKGLLEQIINYRLELFDYNQIRKITTFTDLLRYTMARSQITCEELGNKINVSERSIHKYLNGEVVPGIKILVALCKVLNIHGPSIEVFLDLAGYSLKHEHEIEYLVLLHGRHFGNDIDICNEYLKELGIPAIGGKSIAN